MTEKQFSVRTVIKPEEADALEGPVVVLQFVGRGYANEKYKIVRNDPNATPKEIYNAMQEHYFGYRTEGGLLVCYTD
ncbi:MAG: hypothetical protein IJ421_00165 [Prevotella sp.]|nr:hypothetical protein [Prevotella sp.]